MKEIELKDLRRKREKHFLQENGEIIARVYSDDIHFRKNNIYEEIDNTLIKENNYYKNKKNSYHTFFMEKTNIEIMKIVKDNYFIEIKMKDSNDVLALTQNQTIRYNNILKGIDLEYNLFPTKVKENIIINSKDSIKDKLTFLIKTNLDLELSNKEIKAGKNGQVIFNIETPYMIDNNSNINNNLYYELNKYPLGYELNLMLDINWLEKANYPILIDPTITTSGQNKEVYDTYIYPGDTNVDRNSKDILKAGVEKVNNTNIINRALIKFDLPTIGTGSQIVGAMLNLVGYPVLNGSYESDIVNIHRITNDWTETNANWESMNDKYNTRIEGAFDSIRSTVTETGEVTARINQCDITNLVKKWYTGTPNYGIMLKMNTEEYRNNIIPAFFSKNNTVTGSNPKPVLSISYRNQNGLESYMHYQSQGFTEGNTYFNTYNGNLTGIFNIGSTIGGKLPTSLNLIYNTNDVVLDNNTGLGLGIRFNLNQTIKEVTIDNNTYLEYIDSDGTTHYFYEIDGVYKDEDGLSMTVSRNDNLYILKDKENNQLEFNITNNIGYLTKIIDTSNNYNTITYNNNLITKVVDANNNEINITYETNKITIVSPNETVTLNYNDNKLISIISKLGTTLFTYNSYNIIEIITDINGKKIKYEYYEQSPYRIKKISEYGLNDTLGQYYSVTYGFESTTIIDNKNRSTIMTYNNYGNLISTSNLKRINDLKNAYGMVQEYGKENTVNGVKYTTYKNKLLSSGIPVKYVKNYLTNTSFESNNIIFTSSNNLTTAITEEECNSGLSSLKVISTGTNQTLTKSITVPKDNHYTFSVYLKNTNKVRLGLSYTDSNNQLVESISDTINTNNNFTRYDITINYLSSATSDLNMTIYIDELGTTYIDDIQLEEGEVANKYNMLENSDFSNGLTDWNLTAYKSGTDMNIDTSTIFDIVNINDNNDKALRVKMNPANSTSFSKTFNVKGKMGDEYNISFWYKNEGMYASGIAGDPICNNVLISYEYVNPEEDGGHFVIPAPVMNPNDNDWQYYSTSFKAEKDFKSLTLRIYQQFNCNNFYITNLYLFKDVRENKYTYDTNGNITSIYDLNKQTSDFKYDKNNQLIKMTNPKGKHFTYEYDNDITDRVLSGVSESGINNQIKYDSFSNPVLTRIGKNITDELTYGLYKIRLKGTEKYLRNIKKIVTLDNDTCGHDLWKLEVSGNYYKISHSVINDNYLTITDNSLTLSPFNEITSLFTLVKQNNNSYLIKQKDNDKYLKYDNNTLSITTLVEDDYHYQFYFETNDTNSFIETSATYTEDGRFITSTTDTNFNTTVYDINTITGLTNSITDPKGNITNYTYDNKDRITSITNGNKQINYTYNSNNLLSKITEGNKDYNFIYDNYLNNTQVKIGDNITLVTNNYEDNNGNLLSATYGNNHTINYEYDEFDRIKALTKMNDTYHYKYDNNGDIVKIIANNDITNYSYDLSKKLSEYRFNDFRVNYTYDQNNNIITRDYHLNNLSNSINNTLNGDDDITKTAFETNEINYIYDDLGRLNNRNINNQFNTDYTYVTNGNRTSLMVKSINNNDDKYSYQYDELNNITHIYHNNQLENKYYYDEYNELIKEDNYLTNERINYTYDNSGNILLKEIYDLTNYNFISENKYEYNNTNWEDQLTKFNDEVITYDEIGNPLTIGNKTLTWINGRQLNSYNDGVNSINYKYNIDGIRTSKIVNNIETKYYVEGTSIIFEQQGNNMLYYIRNDIDDLIGFKYNNDTYYYIKNNQDDIIGILDSNYNIIANYKYDSWGNIISITDNNGIDISNNISHIANINPFRYRSYYYDIETKLYYLNSRYYNPIWGRFINIDNILGSNDDIISHNLYNYCSNNPIMNVDESGQGLFKNLVKMVNKTSKKIEKASRTIVSAVKKAVNKIVKNIKSVSTRVSKPMIKSNGGIPDYTEELNKVLMKNTAEALIIAKTFSSPSTINYFYNQVKSDGTWDYKLPNKWKQDIDVPYLGLNGRFLYNGKVTTAEEFGNIHYGFVGTAMGFDSLTLYIGGGYAAKGISIEIIKFPYFGDSVADHNSIKRGIDMFYNGIY